MHNCAPTHMDAWTRLTHSKSPRDFDREQERIVDELEKQWAFIDGYNKYIATNLRRADDLIRLAENFEKGRPSPIRDDILRAAVVFLHATLEDFLRYIRSPEGADSDTHRFSSTGRISQFLSSVGIPTDEVEKLYPSLGELMERRHQIVHKGDLKPTRNQEGERDPVPIEASKVSEWFETVINFTATITPYKL
jgi:hypothetical protein